MAPALTLAIYCLLIVLASLAGGWIPMLVRLTHRRMEIALSFISGVMVGVALLLLLPHAFAARMEATSLTLSTGDAHEAAHQLLAPVMLSLLAGFLVMFLIERFFNFHHHAAPDEDGAVRTNEREHQHDHDHNHNHIHEHTHAHALHWSGAAIGLALHGLLDGVALAASVAAARNEPGHAAGLLAGFGAFLVILLHKPFDSLTLGTLMAAGDQSRGSRHAVNLIFALLVPIGAGLFMLGLTAGESQSAILSVALAFAAGTFLCIALSDLLPELQFHHHDRMKLTLALVLGLAVAWAISMLEAGVH